MSSDPQRLFVSSQLTRATIAAELNEALQALGSDIQLASDDDRLTDAVCAAYAAKIGNISGGPDKMEDAAGRVRMATIRELHLTDGLVDPDQQECLSSATVQVTIVLSATLRRSAKRRFSAREVLDWCGQNTEIALRDAIDDELDHNSAFTLLIEEVMTEVRESSGR